MKKRGKNEMRRKWEEKTKDKKDNTMKEKRRNE